jgi:hypothetical protein
MPVFKHFAGVLVNDCAEEMLSHQCSGVFSGSKMVDGEGIIERKQQRGWQAGLYNGNGVRNDTVDPVGGAFTELAVCYWACKLGSHMLLPAPP